MYYLRFTLEGLVNSYRIPNFKTFHKSYLAPTRTNILGMIANISDLSEHDYYELLNKDLEIAIVIKQIKGELKDLWIYKSFGNNNGRSPIRRSKYFKPVYIVYLKSGNKDLIHSIWANLISPKKIPSMGMDDELIVIRAVKKLNEKEDIEEQDTKEIHSVLPCQNDNYLSFNVNFNTKYKTIIYPTDNIVVKNFQFSSFSDTNRSARSPGETTSIKEFYNCSISLDKQIKAYCDKEYKSNILFY